MSVPYSIKAKEDFSQKLLTSPVGNLPASQRIPLLAKAYVSERALKTLDIVSRLMFPPILS